MKTNFFLIAIIAFATSSIFGCKKDKDEVIPFHQIKVINNNSKGIYFYYDHYYPDTVTPISINSIKHSPSYYVVDSKTSKYWDIFGTDKTVMYPALGVRFYIFDKQLFDTVPDDTIIKYNMFLKRYFLNEDEYKSLKGKVIYD